MKKSAEPKWNQTFIYSHVHRRDFRERMLEITVWDQPRVQEEESEFLGEVGDRSVMFKYKYKCLHLSQVLVFAAYVHRLVSFTVACDDNYVYLPPLY